MGRKIDIGIANGFIQGVSDDLLTRPPRTAAAREGHTHRGACPWVEGPEGSLSGVTSVGAVASVAALVMSRRVHW